ncbi:MAG: ECF transporter S component [Anaerocolumna sp.]
MNIGNNTRKMTLSALLGAIILLLNFTPIGYIQLPIIKATIIHVPVIIGSILLGPTIGAGLGVVFGLTSLYNNTFAPTLLSFAFSPVIPIPGTDRGSFAALIVTFLPRILVGIFPYYAYKLLNKLLKEKGRMFSLGLSGIIGSMTNTILVMHLIYFIFRNAYGEANHIAVDTVYKTVLTIIFANGIPEAVIAAVITAAVCRALLKYGKLNY